MRSLILTSALVVASTTRGANAGILGSFPAFGALPSVITTILPGDGPVNATTNAANALNLNNIQGDVLIGMRKQTENFVFFSITDPPTFQTKLSSVIIPVITTTAELLKPSLNPDVSVNLAFSQSGLNVLGVTDNLGDTFFSRGMFTDATALGDPGTGNWVDAFKGTEIHGVFLLASDQQSKIDKMTTFINASKLGITVLYNLQGAVRPGSEAGHEHFGFLDGISQPAVAGFTTSPLPGQTTIDPGILLLGRTGDNIARPAWATDSSFLVFRQLQQLVPEFNKFVADQAAANSMDADLLGARIIGRWKSGAPVDLSPNADNLTLAADPMQNNNFTFSHPGSNINSDQTRCPFSAHIRKTRPRDDLPPSGTITHHIMRSGIPYGPEMNKTEITTSTTLQERGLAFVSYQSQINQGFRFITQVWANSRTFPPGKTDLTPGVDPVIGQLNGAARVVSGLVQSNPRTDITFPTQHVISRGGEYFLIPSMRALKTNFGGSF